MFEECAGIIVNKTSFCCITALQEMLLETNIDCPQNELMRETGTDASVSKRFFCYKHTKTYTLSAAEIN